jgi:hypothetical protein
MNKIFKCMLFTFGITLNTHAAILNEKEEVVPEVISIFNYFKDYIPAEEFEAAFEQGNPEITRLNDLAQKYFIRPKGSERQDAEAMAHYKRLYASLGEQNSKALIECFQRLGDIDAVYPHNKSPDYILIQGSTVPNMRARVMFVAKLLKDGFLELRPCGRAPSV